MCFCLNCFFVFLLNKRVNSCQVTFCKLIRFSRLEISDGSQPRTHLITRNAFSWWSFLATGSQRHFAPYSSEGRKDDNQKHGYFLLCHEVCRMVLLWAGVVWPNFLLDYDCGRADVAVFQGKKMAAVTVLLVSFKYTYRWTALFFLFLQVWLGFWKAFLKDTFLEGFLLLCKASQSLWLLRSKSKTDKYCQICKFFFPVIFIWTVSAKHEQEYCSDDMIPWLILKNSKSAAVWVACLSF